MRLACVRTDRPIIVGTGIAGLWAAWRLAAAGRGAVLVTKETLTDSASAWARGGIAVALDPDDSPELHAADTLAAGDGLCDPDAVRILTRDGPERVRELLALGAGFDRDAEGRLRFGLEAGHTRSRILHAGGDRTGAVLVGCLIEILRRHPLIEIREHAEVKRLVHRDGRVAGVVALEPGGAALALAGPAVVLATGGLGQLYEVTTNPRTATGDGVALAHEVGAELRDLEFLQFHPTALKLPGVNPAPLISEALRGARAVPDFAAQFPATARLLASYGLDPAADLLPVAPAVHYAMGGVRTDLDGRTTVPGLWAVGEVACTGVHGANRLASNSLLEGLVFADRAGRALASEPVSGAPDVAATLAEEDDTGADAACEAIRAEMRAVMTRDVGLARTEASLARAERTLGQLAAAVPAGAWRTAHQLLVARLIARAARRRRESRGGHWRADYPRRPRVGAGV